MPKENQKLEVKINEDELRDLIHGEEFRWIIRTNEGEDIDVLVMLDRYDKLADVNEEDEDGSEPTEEETEEDDDNDDDDDSF